MVQHKTAAKRADVTMHHGSRGAQRARFGVEFGVSDKPCTLKRQKWQDEFTHRGSFFGLRFHIRTAFNGV